MGGGSMGNTGVGDQLLDKALDDAIKATNDPVVNGVCAHHDSLRMGVNVLLRCQKAFANSGSVNNESEVTLLGGRLLTIKGTKISGRDAVLMVIIVGTLFLAGWTYYNQRKHNEKNTDTHTGENIDSREVSLVYP